MASLKGIISALQGVDTAIHNAILAIVGLSTWNSAPDISLHNTDASLKAVLGEVTSTTAPAISLHNTDASLKAVLGEVTSTTAPAISLHNTAVQINAITGKSAPTISPDVSLATLWHYINTTNPFTGFGVSAQPLGVSQSAGAATTLSRSDHVHPFPSLANIGAADLAGSSTQQFQCADAYSATYALNKNMSDAYLASKTGNAANDFYSLHSYSNAYSFTLNTSAYLQCTGSSANFVYTGTCYFAKVGGGDGDIYVGNVSYLSTTNRSDERLKDIKCVNQSGHGFDKLMALTHDSFIQYTLKEDADKPDKRTFHGFSAQKLQAAMPEIVSELPDSNGDSYLCYDPNALIAYLVDTVRVLNSRILILEGNKK